MTKLLSSALIVSLVLWSLLLFCPPTHQSKAEFGTGFMFKYEPNFNERQEAEATLKENVQSVINHYKKQEAAGILFIKDPLTIGNFHSKFSGIKLAFQDSQVYGLSRFRVDNLQADLAELKVSMKLSMPELVVAGSYVVSAWASRQGGFNVSILDTELQVDAELIIEESGSLQVGRMKMDFNFGNLEMQFEKLGFLRKMLQGIMNNVGSFVFDTIKPTMWIEIESKLREILNSEARDIPKQFPNSINPFDKTLEHARKVIVERNLDPVALADYSTHSTKWSKFELFNGNLHDLSRIRRREPVLLGFEQNTTYMTVHLGVENLKGSYEWLWTAMRGVLSRRGQVAFNLDFVDVEIKLQQTSTLQEKHIIDSINVTLGPTTLESSGIGAVNYILEMIFNVVPNVFRQRIADAAEYPLSKALEEEMQKINIESFIEDNNI